VLYLSNNPSIVASFDKSSNIVNVGKRFIHVGGPIPQLKKQ